ncbi:MAG: DUF3426 domain-containing protein [Mariprofundus sp.]
MYCPHCQTRYNFPPHCARGEFVCYCCRKPLCIAPPVIGPDASFTPNLIAAPLPMQRRQSHLQRWFMLMLIIVAAGGFIMQRDAWLNNSWFRSQLIHIGFDMPTRSSDWQIEPESIKPRWITRDDGSRVLLLQGMIENRLSVARPLPWLLVTFYAREQPDQPLGSSSAHVILMPEETDIRRQGFLNPVWEMSEAPAQSRRAFVILLQHLPEKTDNFTLMPSPTTAQAVD